MDFEWDVMNDTNESLETTVASQDDWRWNGLDTWLET